MPPRRIKDAEADREAAKKAPIQVRGLAEPDLPKRVIAHELYDRIRRGVYLPGEQVPSIADLMAMTETAKNTCRAALDLLRDAQVIKTLTGFGTFVRPKEDWQDLPGD